MKFIELYRKFENRKSAQEVREHVFWMLRDFKTEQYMKKVLKFKTIGQIEDYINLLE